MAFQPKYVVGKRIVSVNMRSWVDQAEGSGCKKVCHDPHITLDDGSVLRFVVEETADGGCYGVAVVRDVMKTKAEKTKKSKASRDVMKTKAEKTKKSKASESGG